MITITLPDGAEKQVEAGASPLDLAAQISPSLAKRALLARVNGQLWDVKRAFEGDSKLELLTLKDEELLELLRHDTAHLMAQAVQELFPNTQVTIGPTIKDGFYYDFAREDAFTPEDFDVIEKRMHELIDADIPIEREVWARVAAIDFFKSIGEHYKAEIIADLPEDEEITLYRQDDWVDLCRGPHLPSTGKIPKAFKLMNIAGAYWRGDSNKEMLQRIYGTAWRDPKELRQHLHMLEEAQKRDHRKLGQQLELFHLQSEAQGSVFWHPKGTQIWLALENYIRRKVSKAGYLEVKSPQLIDRKFWEQSGHWQKYRDNMFIAPDISLDLDEEEINIPADAKIMALKPMNCPAHVQIFMQQPRSYRQLPMRLAEFGCCHRNEAHGALHGLLRVRQMTQDDAHIFCTQEQLVDEAVAFCDLTHEVYTELGFDQVDVKLATRPEVRAGSDEIWDLAEEKLAQALTRAGTKFEIEPGEGAFYGPKVEFHLTDAIGRSWQCATLQLDFVLAQRLDAFFIDENSEKQRPVMLHRAILGTLERFIGVLIEHHAGALPPWLSPIQLVVAPITDDAAGYARQVEEAFSKAGLRTQIDTRNEKINYKIREHSHQKIPFIAVVGEKEKEAGTIALRRFGEGAKRQEILALVDAVSQLSAESLPPDLKR